MQGARRGTGAASSVSPSGTGSLGAPQLLNLYSTEWTGQVCGWVDGWRMDGRMEGQTDEQRGGWVLSVWKWQAGEGVP